MMKILIPTPVFPEKKSIRINFINRILTELHKTINVEVIWFVFLPDKFLSYSFKDGKVSDIHDFFAMALMPSKKYNQTVFLLVHILILFSIH